MTYHHYKPADKIHISDDVAGPTLCGLAHTNDEDVRADIGDDLGRVLPKYTEYCYRCRAKLVTRVQDDLAVDVTSLDEGDVVEFWTHDDPTDPSSTLCLRKEGVIVETPPWELTTGRDSTATKTNGYRVQMDSITYTSASFDRIWRVNHTSATDILSDSELEEALTAGLMAAHEVDR